MKPSKNRSRAAAALAVAAALTAPMPAALSALSPIGVANATMNASAKPCAPTMGRKAKAGAPMMNKHKSQPSAPAKGKKGMMNPCAPSN